MANHKSAKKRIRTSAKRKKVNKATASELKTLVKKVKVAKDKETAEPLLKAAVSFLDKTVSKGRLHKNTAARKKSQLVRHVNGLS